MSFDFNSLNQYLEEKIGGPAWPGQVDSSLFADRKAPESTWAYPVLSSDAYSMLEKVSLFHALGDSKLGDYYLGCEITAKLYNEYNYYVSQTFFKQL